MANQLQHSRTKAQPTTLLLAGSNKARVKSTPRAASIYGSTMDVSPGAIRMATYGPEEPLAFIYCQDDIKGIIDYFVKIKI